MRVEFLAGRAAASSRGRKSVRRNRRAARRDPGAGVGRLAEWIEKSPSLRIWVRLNQSLTLFALIVASFGFAIAVRKFDVDERKADEDRLAKAWDVVSRMSGKQSNGGQVAALERLNSRGVPLDFLDIHQTYAPGMKLSHARLHGANLAGANLEAADLSAADLEEADLTGANLLGANLSGADLAKAKLRNAKLAFARVDISVVLASDMRNTDLTGAAIVFAPDEDDEDGETWAAFSDSLSDNRELNEVQALFDTACASPRFVPEMYPRLKIEPPRRQCPSEPNYVQLSSKYSRKDWGVPLDELLDVHLPKPEEARFVRSRRARASP
jgi:hypothetical protein